MKTLKTFVAEVYKPRSPDEQKFVDKHVVVNQKDRNGNGDDVFSATNIKTVERKKTNKGYDVGDDEKVYEAADIDSDLEDELMSQRAGKSGANWRAKKKLVGNQHKIDANKNGKIDAHDFKLLRKEEAEELDEISQKMVRAYRDKARDDKESAEDDREYYKAHDDNTDDEDKRIRKRTAGIKMAGKKIYGGAKVPMKEEEQIDERWSENSKKAGKNLTAMALDVGNAATGGLLSKSKLAKKAMKWADSPDETTSKRRLKAYQVRQARKANEEVEQIDEISTKTLTDYAAKAADARGHRKLSTSKLDKRYKGMALAHEKIRGRHAKVMANEEVEQIDELSKGKMLKYLAANKKDDAKAREKGDVDKMTKRMRGTDMAVRKYTAKPGSKYVRVPATEEVQIDEALDAAARYGQHHVAIKDLMKSISQHIDNHKSDALKHRDYRGKKGVNWGHVSDLAHVHSQLADIHDRLAQQGEYKKAMAESVEDFSEEDYQQIDELSRDTLRRYRMKAKRIGDNEKGDISYRSKGRDLAARKTHGGQWGMPKAKVMASEEAEELDEGKWNYPKHMTKTVTTSDMDTTNAARNREERKAFRKKEKAKAHAALMKGIRKEEVEQVEESWLPKSVHAELKRMPKDAVKRTHDTYMTTAKGFKRNGHHALAAQAHAAAAEIKQKYMQEEVDSDEMSLAELLALKTINSIYNNGE